VLRYHVDAAWGAALIASEQLRGALNGMERADSATIDAHKRLTDTRAQLFANYGQEYKAITVSCPRTIGLRFNYKFFNS
jgi:hypothetical protein